MSLRLTRRRAVLAGLAAAITLAGVSYAAVPDGGGTITACRDQNGGLTVIDTAAGEACRHGQQSLTWNQRGPVGPMGPAGPQGPAGAEIEYFNVTSDGTLASTSYDGPVTIEHQSGIGVTPGKYALKFTESVATCLHWLNFEYGPTIGTADVLSGDSKTLLVKTYTPVGQPVHAAFTLHLAC